MWISIAIHDFWDFCRNLKIPAKESIMLFEFPNRDNVDIWIELDDRYSKLPKKFDGPIFLSHIKKVVPFNQNAKNSIKQLIVTFPNLINYLKV